MKGIVLKQHKSFKQTSTSVLIFLTFCLKVTNEMLDKFISTKSFVAVLFYKKEKQESEDALKVIKFYSA